MNMALLITTVLVTKLATLTNRVRLISVDLTVSCWCAVFMTIGLSVIGSASSYTLIMLGEYSFHISSCSRSCTETYCEIFKAS
jgi:hypothetical protein